MTRPDPTNHQAANKAASVFKGANVTINAAEIRHCPKCYGRLYLVFSTPLRWVHTTNGGRGCEKPQEESK
jgi:hypothetical protein